MCFFEYCSLDNLGADIGARYLELVSIRDKKSLKETKLISMLQFISSNVWKSLFGKVADTLEKSNDNDDECKLLHGVERPLFVSLRLY